MANKPNRPNSANAAAVSSPTSAPNATERAEQARLTLPLTSDGKAIDWSRMRPANQDALRRMLNDPAFVKAAGVQPIANATASAAPDVFNEAWCGMIIDAVVNLEAAAVMRTYNCTPEQARMLLWTDTEKRSIAPALAKVLNKYAGTMFTKYGDEAALLLTFASVSIAKLQALRASLTTSADVRPFPQPVPSVADSEAPVN